MTDRYFVNHYPDYNGQNYFASNHQLLPEINSNITDWIERYTRKLERHLDDTDPSDTSVYTGAAGIALLYLRLAILFPSQRDAFRSKAKELIDPAVEHIKGRRISFLNGDVGPLAIAVVIYNDLNDERMVNKYVDKIISIKDKALDPSNPDEYLYGRSGYLYSLMFLRKQIRKDIIDNQLVIEVFENIIKSGEKYARETHSKSPLMYQWHDSEYFGAAHGVAGIIYLLLKVAGDDSFPNLRSYISSHLIPTVDFLATKRFPSGNYMSSSGSTSDRLVQWCHGAPGFVFLFVQAYKATQNQSYLDLAESAGDVVWERGLLRKGYGICHGAAGNGYTFLDLYQTTNNPKWLHRALKFSEQCFDYGKHDLSRTPDHPYSLFEGLAGTIYFMVDILNPTHAQFPAFEY